MRQLFSHDHAEAVQSQTHVVLEINEKHETHLVLGEERLLQRVCAQNKQIRIRTD